MVGEVGKQSHTRIQGCTGERTKTTGPRMGPIISKRESAMFASDVMIRIQMSWLGVIPMPDLHDFTVVLVPVCSFPRATCQTLMIEVAVMTSVLSGPPWFWWNKQL